MSAVLALVYLLFFQTLTEFIAAIYAFGLLQTGVPPEIVAAVLLFSPFLLVVLHRVREEAWLPWAVAVGLLARAALPYLPPLGLMLASGLGVAALFLVLVVDVMRRPARAHLAGLGLALLLAALLRAWGAGLDPTTQGTLPWLGGVLSLLAGLGWARVLHPAPVVQPRGQGRSPTPAAFGLISVFALLYFAFIAPNVLARWVGTLPQVAYTLFAASLVMWAVALRLGLGLRRPRAALFVTLAFTLALWATIQGHQIPFPRRPEAYPLSEQPAPFWADVAFAAMFFLFPILLVDAELLLREIAAHAKDMARLGRAFGWASVYLFGLILGHVSTTTYDYIPVIGPLFRDRFWLVHLLPAAVLLVALWNLRNEPHEPSPGLQRGEQIGWVVLAAGVVIVGWLRMPRPQPPQQFPQTLRVMTYNIQQGYREDGLRGVLDQLALLRTYQADIIGLQESDTNRIANGNMDLVGFFATELNMYVYYSPKVVHGTFGLALLSRYPLENPGTFFMYSEGEQTATIHARIRVQGGTAHVFVTHLGNDGPMIQQENILQVVQGQRGVILMGDFNFRPDTPQYQRTVSVLRDAWAEAPHGPEPTKHIDHVFVGPEWRVVEARYILSPASDHPALLVQLEYQGAP